jgi:hypothetical protein
VTTGTPEEEPKLHADVTAAYRQFSELQRQKLIMLDHLVDLFEDLDDPWIAARSVLCRRYPHVQPEQFDAVFAAVASYFKGLPAGPPESEGHVPVAQHIPSLDVSRLGIDSFREQFGPVIDQYSGPLTRGYVEAAVTTFLQEMLRLIGGTANAELLRRSVFTAMVADFEAYVSRILTRLHQERPDRLRDSNKTVPLQRVLQSQDLQTLQAELVDAVVIDTMRGPFDEWLGALKGQFGVDVSNYANHPEVTELFQRRHVIMHNGALASRLYVEKCPESGAQVGELLEVSDEYLRRAADRLIVVALALTAKVLFTLLERDRQSATEDFVADRVYQILLDRRYRAVHAYLTEVPFDRFVNESAAAVCKVNLWLALKRLGRFAECRSAVEAWQVTHLGPSYRLARMCLLDDTEAASALSKRLLENGDFRLSSWVEWPLLEEVRKYEAEQEDGSSTGGEPGMLA